MAPNYTVGLVSRQGRKEIVNKKNLNSSYCYTLFFIYAGNCQSKRDLINAYTHTSKKTDFDRLHNFVQGKAP